MPQRFHITPIPTIGMDFFQSANTGGLGPADTRKRVILTLVVVLVVLAAIVWYVQSRPKDILTYGPIDVGKGGYSGDRWLPIFTPEQVSRIRGNNTTFSFFVYVNDVSQGVGPLRTDGTQYLLTVGNVVGVTMDTVNQNAIVDVLQAPPHQFASLNTPVNKEGLVRTVVVKNVMVAKWNQLTVSIEGRSVDVYVNGRLITSAQLDNVPNAQLGGMLLNQSPDFAGQTCLFQMWPERRTSKQVLENYQRNSDLRGKPNVPVTGLSWGNVWERAKAALCDGTGMCGVQIKAGPLDYVEYEFA